MKALKVAALAAVATLGAVNAHADMTWKVLGQPLASGLIQKNQEQPFFENFADKTGLPVKISYKPIDTTGIKDSEELRMLKAGLFDIISIRGSANSRDEPALLGLDLVGLNTDFATARKVVKAYSPVLDKELQQRFHTKLLGVWPFGPQILFCKAPINSFADVKGKKVRVNDQSLANFIKSVGGVPVPLSFPEVQQSLSLGVIDCAVTGPSSANSAGWPEVAKYQMPLSMGMAMNAYGISLKAWNHLNAEQQGKLEDAFSTLTANIWDTSEELYNDALSCNVGGDCQRGKKYDMKQVEPTAADLETVHNALVNTSLPEWAKVCERANKSCSADWKKALSEIVGQ